MDKKDTAPTRTAKKAAPRARGARAVTGPVVTGKRLRDPALEFSARPIAAPIIEGEVVSDDGEDPAKPRTVTYRGRTMRVQMPSQEGLIVWRRSGKQALALGERERRLREQTRQAKTAQARAELETEHQELNQASQDLYERLMLVIESLLVDPADMAWLQEEFLRDRTLTIADVSVDMMHPAITALTGLTIGEPAPTTGPKARRRR